ncbi:hypothetical protein RQP46_006095 [Phenoliferia psychrophenolica]
MATIDDLPYETLSLIMNYLKGPSSFWDTPRGRYDALRAAALVCSRWRDPAQRALSKEVVISQDDSHRAIRFLASPAKPRHRTRSLCTHGLPLIPLVKAVAVMCYPAISNLEITGSKGDLLDWNGLSSTAFAGELLDQGVSLKMRLSSLAMRIQLDEGEGATNFLAALASSSQETLKTLRLDFYTSDSSKPPRVIYHRTDNDKARLPTALRPLGTHIRFLILQSPWDNLEQNLNIFPVFQALESLSWHGSSSQPLHPLLDVLMGGLHSILDAIPSPATLRHLSIGVGANDFALLLTFSQFLSHRALKLLTILDFPFLASATLAKRDLYYQSLAALMARECEERGIKLRIGGTVEVFSFSSIKAHSRRR